MSEKSSEESRAEFHLARGEAYRLLGDCERAATEYQAALAFDPDLRQAHIGLSVLRMPGDDYLKWLQLLHSALAPESYLEIGVARGLSLSFACPPTRAIGVDLQPMINVQFTAETHIFCETSDDFFAKGRLTSLLSGRPLSLAFIDGEHVFTQSLKDFMHVEAFCGDRSIVLIHDTIPLDEVTQRPDRQRKFYTGDVWKTVLCLKHYRPDLDIFTIATPWSGLTVVTGLNPASRILVDRYQETIERFVSMPYADVEDRLEDALSVVANNWDIVAARLKRRNIL